MIQKIEIAGVHTKLDKDTKDYAVKKLSGLDKYAPASARQSLHLEIKLKAEKATKTKTTHVCEAVLFLPQDQITVHTTGSTFEAAIDVAEDKLKIQIAKYKSTKANPRIHQRIIKTLLRK